MAKLSKIIRLSRAQELRLIRVGLDVVLHHFEAATGFGPIDDEPAPAPKQRPAVKRRWSPAQRAKFRGTMKRLWAERKGKSA